MSARIKLYQLYIDGQFVDSTSNRWIDVIDPGDAGVDRARARADRRPKWTRRSRPRAARSTRGRGRTSPRRSAGAFSSASRRSSATTPPNWAELETRNNGKPIVEAEFDIADVATCFEYYGGLATKIHGDVMPVPDNALSLALREPIGVAGQIIPWNYPLLMAAWKLAPAICAGCTMVLKPAEQTPLTVLELAAHFEAAGLPPGVVNIVTGYGADRRGARRASRRRQDRVHRQRRGRQDHHARARPTR